LYLSFSYGVVLHHLHQWEDTCYSSIISNGGFVAPYLMQQSQEQKSKLLSTTLPQYTVRNPALSSNLAPLFIQVIHSGPSQ